MVSYIIIVYLILPFLIRVLNIVLTFFIVLLYILATILCIKSRRCIENLRDSVEAFRCYMVEPIPYFIIFFILALGILYSLGYIPTANNTVIVLVMFISVAISSALAITYSRSSDKCRKYSKLYGVLETFCFALIITPLGLVSLGLISQAPATASKSSFNTSFQNVTYHVIKGTELGLIGLYQVMGYVLLILWASTIIYLSRNRRA